jgi:TPR repeat protein
MCHQGQAVMQDYQLALFWYGKAAEQKYAPAEYALGVMYDEGLGVSQDYRQATSWYKKAAEKDHVEAQYNLGFNYYHGLGVPQDYSEAHKWFSLSGKGGVEDGKVNAEIAEKRMTPLQITEAKRLAAEWIRAHQ